MMATTDRAGCLREAEAGCQALQQMAPPPPIFGRDTGDSVFSLPGMDFIFGGRPFILVADAKFGLVLAHRLRKRGDEGLGAVGIMDFRHCDVTPVEMLVSKEQIDFMTFMAGLDV